MAPSNTKKASNFHDLRAKAKALVHRHKHVEDGNRIDSNATSGHVGASKQAGIPVLQLEDKSSPTALAQNPKPDLDLQVTACGNEQKRSSSSAQDLLDQTVTLSQSSKKPPSSQDPITLTPLHHQELSLLGLSKSEALWSQAYAALRLKEPDVVREYEQIICPSFGNFAPAERMSGVVRQRLHDLDLKALTLTLAGKPIKIREIGESIIGFIWQSRDIISPVANTEPHVALAWSGVSLLLLLLLNQKEQNDDMLRGLKDVSHLIQLYKVRAGLYLSDQSVNDLNVNPDFENAVIELYTHILEYQANMLYYLSKPSIKRGGRNALKRDDWKGWLDQVKRCDKKCCDYAALFDIEAEQRAWKNQYSETQRQTSIQEQILEVISKSRNERITERNEERREQLIQSLSTNYKEQKDFNPKRVPGTCEWFLESESFRAWRNATDSQLLWVSAGPGCGKSVLSKCLIDEHRTSNTLMASTITYFFFKDGLEGRHRPENALKAITHQLLTENYDIALTEYALSRYRIHGDKLGGMFGELWSCLIEAARDPAAGEIVCVLDALDECNETERKGLLDSLIDFYSTLPSLRDPSLRLKFLITSRPYHEIESEFAQLKKSVNFIRLDGESESDKIRKEINLVIDHKVPIVASVFREDVQAKIADHLKSMDNRTYLWLHLMLDVIQQKSVAYATEKKMMNIIKDLPLSVNQAYEDILRRSKEPELARRLLHIILAARRALEVSELYVALELSRDAQCRSYTTLDLPSNDIFKSNLKQLCGLFVSIYDDKVYLLHQTARDFLVGYESNDWRHSFRPAESDLCLAQVCTSLLYFDEFKNSPPMYNEKEDLEMLFLSPGYKTWVNQHLFFAYAATHSLKHCALAQENLGEVLLQRVLNLCKVSSRRFKTWSPMFFWFERAMYYKTDLSFASCAGQYKVVNRLLDNGADINTITAHPLKRTALSTALSTASLYGHIEVVRVLLDRGAEVNAQNAGNCALVEACAEGFKEIAHLLIERGAIIDNQDNGYYGTALQAASDRGHQEIVELLLDGGADVHTQGGYYGTALQAACAKRSEEIVRLLLERGVDVNAQVGIFGNALQAASYYDSKEIVRLLLEGGADINARGGEFGTALQAACVYGSKKVVRFLLNEGADINIQGGEYGTALHAASAYGDMEIIKFLLERGADVHAQGGQFGTALQVASLYGCKEIVQLLLDKGADVHAKGGRYGNALEAASQNDYGEVVQLLQSAIESQKSSSPLHQPHNIPDTSTT